MIYAINIHITPKISGSIPLYSGELINAVFYNIIKNIDKEIFYEIHTNSNIKLFTISPLMSTDLKIKNNKILIDKKNRYYFRITLLDELLSEKIIHYLINNLKFINIANINFSVNDIEINSDNKKILNFTTYKKIYKSASSKNKKFIIKFYTPTIFKVNNYYTPFPLPSLVFKLLFVKWNTFSPIKFDIKSYQNIDNFIYTLKYKLKTQSIYHNKLILHGFIGEASYIIKSKDRDIIKTINTLKDYIIFAGIGYHTTMGMGVAKAVNIL